MIGLNTYKFSLDDLNGEDPVLLAYIRRDHIFREQLQVLETVAEAMRSSIKVCMVDENFNEILIRFEIVGDPTFIVFSKGKEKGRLLGRTDSQMLSVFIEENVHEFSDMGKKKNL